MSFEVRRAGRLVGSVGLVLIVGQTLSAQDPSASHSERVIAAARRIMTAARFCTFITVGEKGQPQARIVDPLEPDDRLAVYVATNPRSRKVKEIRADARVTLLYFDPAKLAYVTLVGRAVEASVEEKAAHHKKEWKGFFTLDDPSSYTLYRIVPLRLELVSGPDGLSGDPTTWRPEIVELK